MPLLKGCSSLCTQLHRWISNALYYVKEARLKKLHSIWFHLCGILQRKNYRNRRNTPVVVGGEGIHRNFGAGNGMVQYLIVVEVTQLYAFVRLTELHTSMVSLLYINSILAITMIKIIIIIVMATEAEWALSKRASHNRINSISKTVSLTIPCSLPYAHCLPCVQLLLFTLTFGIFFLRLQWLPLIALLSKIIKQNHCSHHWFPGSTLHALDFYLAKETFTWSGFSKMKSLKTVCER